MPGPGRPKKETPTEKPQEPKPKILYKGNKTFRHDLFKLKVARMKKNVSWKAFEPKIEEVEHCHFFHSFDSKGRKHTTSTKIGGHFHDVEWGVAEGGDLIAECGPPRHKVKRRLRNGQYKSYIEPVKFETIEPGQFVEDNHTHEIDYIHSEELSAAKLQAIRDQNRAVAGAPPPSKPLPDPDKVGFKDPEAQA